MKLWIGDEQEGLFKGMISLFIADKNITILQINDVIDEYSGIRQLYFGAGLTSTINEKVVKQCLKEYPKKIITLEINLNQLDKYNQKLLKEVNVIITLNHKNIVLLNKLNTSQIKLQSLETKERVLLIGLQNNFSIVPLKKFLKKTYKNDKVII